MKKQVSKASILRDIDLLICEKSKEISDLKLKIRDYERLLGDCAPNSDSIADKMLKMHESIEQYKRHENLQSALIKDMNKARASLYEKNETLSMENEILNKRIKELEKPQKQPDE